MSPKQHAINVLRYWALVEEFTPPEIEKEYKTPKTKSIQSEVFADRDIPWLEKKRFETHESTNEHEWEYTVFLGVNKINSILDTIKSLFSDTQEGYSEQGDKNTCMLAFKVDVNGKPLQNSLEIPDYIVSIGCVTQCDPPSLACLDHGKKAFIREQLKDIYRNFCDEFVQKKRVRPVDFALLHRLLQDVLAIIGWGKITKPTHETPQNLIVTHGKEIPLAAKGQEKSFFNSLFIRDINGVTQKWQKDPSGISKPLQQYLAPEPPELRKDLADSDVLRQYVSPEIMAPARWPCAGDYRLAINQQVAVNLALNESSGLFSVNGPPGTGKTTLLNDVISNIIVKRAHAIASLNKPTDAFEKPIQESIDRKTYTIWKPKSILEGYEIVIASNNNNAVENISKEIPGKKAIDPKWQLDYFADLSQHILGINKCWGLCAAALGRQDHINKFFGNFWKGDQDKKAPGFNDWLLVCQQNKTKAQTDWLEAKAEFQSALQAYEAMRKQLIDLAQDLEKLHTATQQLQKVEQQQASLAQQKVAYETTLKTLGQPKALLEEKYNDHTTQLNYWKQNKPAWWRRFRADGQYQQWSAGYAKALDAKKAAKKALHEWAQQVREMQDKVRTLAHTQKLLTEQLSSLKIDIAHQEKYIKRHKTNMGRHFPDSTFWQQPTETLQQCTPWHSEELHKLRGALFVKAMNLHRAFISRAATQFYDNLSSLNALVANRKKWPSQEKVLPSLWTSLFTVVPVISTTLASIGNLKGLGKQDIGWLLIDEAGQVAPQAAVGALQRAKRVITVGDPLQIPPVVTIPKSMSQVFLAHYQLTSMWDVHNTSVQQLADKSNIFGTHIGRKERIWVGAPLRVHRRCQDPMFTVANTIAYEGLMVQATSSQTSPLAQSLKTNGWPAGSYWLNVKGRLSGTNHWIPEEGEAVLRLLAQMGSIYQRPPKVYIIAPFRNIVSSLQELLKTHRERWIGQNIDNERAHTWIRNSVGTIHTFQGREADGVILVLGASNSVGARRWASESPNILNVALTRAKDFCFVVGNCDVWSQQEYFSTLADALPIITDGDESA